MKSRSTPVAALALTAVLGLCAPATHAAQQPERTPPKDAYATKKAECTKEAKAKNFGTHLVKRNRWILNCIAGERT
jgi:hypothetical protein